MVCGFDSVATQITSRRTLNGLAFNIIVVGPTGIGKTTLINSLFDFEYGDTPGSNRNSNNVELRVKEFKSENNTIGMKLTIIETKGFNNQLDRSEMFKPIVDYIEARYEDYLNKELQVKETNNADIADSRVHCCLYMISPTARGLKPIDLVTMKMLHERVCLIPVIGRSDQLTLLERQTIKRSITVEMREAGIKVYQSHDHDVPFAIAASDDKINENGKTQRIRNFPWGRMYIERDSDFPQLRDLLLRSHMLSLIDVTHYVHYEKYRAEAAREFLEYIDLKASLEKEKKLLREVSERENRVY